MKRILITDSFLKILRKYRRNFNEEDVVVNVKEFIRIGFRRRGILPETLINLWLAEKLKESEIVI